MTSIAPDVSTFTPAQRAYYEASLAGGSPLGAVRPGATNSTGIWAPSATRAADRQAYWAANGIDPSVIANTSATGTPAPTSTDSTGDFASFLNNGQIPSGSAVKSLTSQTVLPEWYSNYAMDLLAQQKAAAATPYQPYQGPRIADFNGMQQRGFNQVLGQANAYLPSMRAATEATQGVLGQSTLGAASPFFGDARAIDPAALGASDFGGARSNITAATNINPGAAASQYYSGALGMNPLATGQPDFNASRSTIGGALGYDAPGAAMPYFNQAGSMNALGAASPYLSGAAGYTLNSTRGSGLEAAMPWLRAASDNVADVGEYMNPYQDAVVNRIADLGARNLRDVLMPSIEGRYIQAGQLGGSGQMTDTARAIRDISDDILGQQSLALQQGYAQAQGFKGSDLGRYAGLGATAGDLASRQQQIVANAGRTLADIGATAGNLTAGQQRLLADMGVNLGQLTQGQQRGALDAAQQMAGLGATTAGLTRDQQQLLAGIGTNMGNFAQGQQRTALDAAQQQAALGQTQAALGQDQQKFLANLGISTADIMGTDLARQLAASNQLADYGGLMQKYGLEGAGAITGVGNQLQNMQQQNLNVAYEDYLRQQGYPQAQIDAMLNTFKAVAPGVPTGTKEFGIVPTGQPAEYKPSTASTIASGLAGAAGLADLLKDIF